MSNSSQTETGAPEEAPLLEEERRKLLPPAAQRALAEADARRAERAAQEAARPRELGGQDGPEPTRYGDWEKKGILSDF